jgi:hypothetical protein
VRGSFFLFIQVQGARSRAHSRAHSRARMDWASLQLSPVPLPAADSLLPCCPALTLASYQVLGCAAPDDLSELFKVHWRAKACPTHLRAVIDDAVRGELRFCQRCAKWESVGVFEVRIV